MFKTAGLNITTQEGLRILDILGVQFNLKNDTYRPYKKATTKINSQMYI